MSRTHDFFNVVVDCTKPDGNNTQITFVAVPAPDALLAALDIEERFTTNYVGYRAIGVSIRPTNARSDARHETALEVA